MIESNLNDMNKIFPKKKLNQYSGMDTDRDNIDDGYEVATGRHDTHNQPLHKHIQVGNKNWYKQSGIFGFEHSFTGVKTSLNSPKKRNLEVNVGNHKPHQHIMNTDHIHSPHKQKLNTDKIRSPRFILDDRNLNFDNLIYPGLKKKKMVRK